MNRLAFELELVLGKAEVRAFAALTGDFSSLHMDAEFARRTRYRRQVVHGMLPVSLLACLGRDLPPGRSLRFESLEVRFQRPVHLGDGIRMEARAAPVEAGTEGMLAVEAKVFGLAGPRPELATTVRGKARVEAQGGMLSAASRASLLTQPLEEAKYELAEVDGCVESLRFCADPVTFYRFLEEICPDRTPREAVPCANLAAALTTSTLVGMRLPGRNATFRGMALEFARNLEPGESYMLEGAVRRISPAATLAQADLCIRGEEGEMASGSLEVLVNPPPGAMPSVGELAASPGGPGLQGQVVIVAGGSRGIGETCAKLLGLQGAQVVLTYYQGASDAQRVADELAAAGADALVQRCDARNTRDVEAVRDAALERFGRVDGLVYCAVGEFISRPLQEQHWSHFAAELEVSLGGLHAFCAALRPALRESGGGRVVAFSTVATREPPRGQGPYVAAKGAVEAYVRSLAKELAGDNIQVNALLPQMTETDLVAGIPAALRERLADARGSGRHLRAEEVARVVCLMLSPWGAPISGQCILLNQGEPPFL